MKVAIISCFFDNNRLDLLYNYFIGKGNFVSVIVSDFKHIEKVKRTNNKKDFIFIKTKPYNKNISISRLISHYFFARKAFEVVEDLKPDCIYVLIPPNSLALFAAKYKEKNPKVKLIFDLIDLWPENIPISKIENLPLFSYWRKMRDKNIKMADIVITECDFYQDILRNVLKNITVATLYPLKKFDNYDSHPTLDNNVINLCYLGSINNVIDIRTISKMIRTLATKKLVKIHIIGDGESKDTLIKEAQKAGAIVKLYGIIFNKNEKQKIFDFCNFGFNMMKDSVHVGLTLKSIDYFEAGLPILNTIKGDTRELVEKYKVGFNISPDNINQIAERIMSISEEELLVMRIKTREMFEELFLEESFNMQIKNILEKVNIP